MKAANGLPIRRSVRLREFHYSGAASYFITVCSYRGMPNFGRCTNGIVTLSWIGEIVQRELLRTAEMRPEVILDRHVVMPNHLHAIIFLPETGSNSTRQFLKFVMGGYKSAVTSEVRRRLKNPSHGVWQRGFHEHIIRSDRGLENIRRYIDENPTKWECDRHYCK